MSGTTNVISYERVRASTLKSSYVFPLLGAALAIGVSLIHLSGDAKGEFADLIRSSYSPLSSLLLTVPFAQAFGHDYRDGTMRLTLSEFPKRGKVYLAKLAIPAGLAIAGCLIMFAGLAITASTGDIEFSASAIPLMLRVVAYTVMWGIVVATVVILTRNLVAGVAIVLIWMLLLESIVGQLLGSVDLGDFAKYLPMTAGYAWMSEGNGSAGLTMLVFTAAFATLGYLKFTKKDA